MAGAAPEPPYRIQASRAAGKGLADLPARKQQAVKQFIRQQLAVNPLQRIPGKTKRLKGAYKGFLQYDVDDNYRIIYLVEKEKRTVYLDYIGPHPKW